MAEPGPPADGPPTDGRLASFAADHDVSPRRGRLHRLAQATRRVIHATVGTDADDATIEEAAVAVERAATVLERFEQHSFHGFAEAANAGDPHGFLDQSPMLGKANALAPPLTLQSSDDRHVVATARFGVAYEGPPGCVHGGYVSAAFDDVLGMAQSLSGQHGMTGRLSISYRSPTPLHDELRFVGRFERIEGRKIFTTGTLHVGDRLCAEAEALFITVDFAKFAELDATRRQPPPAG